MSKVVKYDLGVVGSFAPEIVIVQLGSNDLTSMSAAKTGSAIEDLARLLFECYGVKLVCVCQTIFRRDSPSFNKQVKLLTQYLKVVLEPLPYVIYRRHGGFWNCKTGLSSYYRLNQTAQIPQISETYHNNTNVGLGRNCFSSNILRI